MEFKHKSVLLEETIELRHQLNQIPEKSECEVKTMALLKEWLKNRLTNPNYEIVDKQTWFYVVYKSVKSTRKPIAYRADMDAVTVNEEVENEEYREVALNRYESVLASYDISYKAEVAYLLYTGVLTTDELSNYISNSAKNQALKRYEAAVLLTKLVGG